MKKYELEVDIVKSVGKELWITTAKNKEEAIENFKQGECDKEVLEMESETDEIDFNEIQEA